MPIEQKKEGLLLEHHKGPSVDLLWFGAHVLSWKSAIPSRPDVYTNRIFTSSKSPLDGSVPIRGGIPIVFPTFATPSHPDHLKLPNHGFARTEIWKWDGNLIDNQHEITIHLTLDDTPRTRRLWDKPFHLDYIISLQEFSLTTTLRITNTSASAPFDFQALFHTYHACPSASTRVAPLHGLTYFDKNDIDTDGQPKRKVEGRAEGLDVLHPTDAVFVDPPREIDAFWPLGGVHISTIGTPELVVWNPQATAGQKIAEMEDEGWEKFVCIEPGFARSFKTLEAGKTHVCSQRITAL
ncbi:galactose mutarotase-like protein [Cylindrobasidium torrendii FP15055 ss-10]|uniref:Glucose-6-phosphate 1-epimerase n=1 Tax=Cylindrobasidium torrendii FP15055 ss-10 TaxID=1314674 RepID=A0A0D7AX34_9AGAR|nr:galactose mutarotase-like protein [Cylindrobasidium torrendii FP15055 ss-10]